MKANLIKNGGLGMALLGAAAALAQGQDIFSA